MSKVYNGIVCDERFVLKDHQPFLFKDDGNDPRGGNWTPGDLSKTGKWTHSPWNWFPNDEDHGECYRDLQYLYLSEIGGVGKDKYYVYRQ